MFPCELRVGTRAKKGNEFSPFFHLFFSALAPTFAQWLDRKRLLRILWEKHVGICKNPVIPMPSERGKGVTVDKTWNVPFSRILDQSCPAKDFSG